MANGEKGKGGVVSFFKVVNSKGRVSVSVSVSVEVSVGSVE